MITTDYSKATSGTSVRKTIKADLPSSRKRYTGKVIRMHGRHSDQVSEFVIKGKSRADFRRALKTGSAFQGIKTLVS